jgi:hypothetical protein
VNIRSASRLRTVSGFVISDALVGSLVNTNTYMLSSLSAYGIFTTSDSGKVVEVHMPRRSPFRIALTPAEAAELGRRASKYTSPYFEVVRAKMILMAAEGLGNDEIAARLDTRREVVSQWRKRFFKQRLAGLEERPRPGRPRAFPPRTHG